MITSVPIYDKMKLVWGNVTIEGNIIIGSSTEVSNPIAVRHGRESNPPASLYNKANFPASPFRTDADH